MRAPSAIPPSPLPSLPNYSSLPFSLFHSGGVVASWPRLTSFSGAPRWPKERLAENVGCGATAERSWRLRPRVLDRLESLGDEQPKGESWLGVGSRIHSGLHPFTDIRKNIRRLVYRTPHRLALGCRGGAQPSPGAHKLWRHSGTFMVGRGVSRMPDPSHNAM